MPYKGATYRGSASGEIVESSFERNSLDATEVLIRITHSGLCGTDLHALHHDMVLGHEGTLLAILLLFFANATKASALLRQSVPLFTNLQSATAPAGDMFTKRAVNAHNVLLAEKVSIRITLKFTGC